MTVKTPDYFAILLTPSFVAYAKMNAAMNTFKTSVVSGNTKTGYIKIAEMIPEKIAVAINPASNSIYSSELFFFKYGKNVLPTIPKTIATNAINSKGIIIFTSQLRKMLDVFKVLE